MFIREQDEILKLFGRSKLPKLIIDASDDDIARVTEEVVDWFRLNSIRRSENIGGLDPRLDIALDWQSNKIRMPAVLP
jgi:hypothetical protein